MLTTLFLCNKELLSKPALYMSCYLKEHRVEYYDRLMEVRTRGAYEQWVEFFVRGILEIAGDAITTIGRLIRLRAGNLEKIAGLGRSAKTVRKLYGAIERNPIIEIGKTAGTLNLSYNTAAKAADHLVSLGILRQTGANRRNRCFAYAGYLDILRQGT
jgi:Fic family protein